LPYAGQIPEYEPEAIREALLGIIPRGAVEAPSVSEHDRHAGVWAVNLHIEFAAIRAAQTVLPARAHRNWIIRTGPVHQNNDPAAGDRRREHEDSRHEPCGCQKCPYVPSPNDVDAGSEDPDR
jgi:hypothetical protein